MSHAWDDDEEDRPALTPKLAAVVLESQHSFLENEDNKKIIADHRSRFAEAIKSWRASGKNKNQTNDHNPILDEATQAMLLDGFDRIVDALDKSRLMNGDGSPRYSIDKEAVVIEIKKQLRQAQPIMDYKGYKESAVEGLVGSTIKAAMDALQAVGYCAPGISRGQVLIKESGIAI